MMAFIRGLNVVTATAVENYILKVYPQIYKQVKRQKPGQSETLVGSDVYYRRNEWDKRKQQYDDEATSLLTNINQSQNYAYLIKKNSFDRIDVNKPVFRIGKERSYADYSVMNNNAVSRLHADIINKNGVYFIKDNNSTNGTFVNGVRIQSNIEVEIFDGNTITLANEEFDFHID